MSSILPFRQKAQKILAGTSDLKVLIVGPCSIHNPDEMLSYAKSLKPLIEQTSDKLFIVLRAFIEKPRTSLAWRGFVHDPLLTGIEDLKLGMSASVKLFQDLNGLGMPLAMEFVDPNLAPIFAPHITWGFIGARTMRSPLHRQLASYLDMPIGFKNPLDGDLSALKAAIEIAAHPHEALMANSHKKLQIVRSKGNKLTHAVLRGSTEGSNFNKALHMQGPLMIDCAHGNSAKTVEGMEKTFLDASAIMQTSPHVIGLMLESYLHEGSQILKHPLKEGISITDPCLGLTHTLKLIQELYKALCSKICPLSH